MMSPLWTLKTTVQAYDLVLALQKNCSSRMYQVTLKFQVEDREQLPRLKNSMALAFGIEKVRMEIALCFFTHGLFLEW